MDPELRWAPGRAHPGAPYPGTGVSSPPRSFGKSVSFLRAPWGRSRMGSDQRGQVCSAVSGRELVGDSWWGGVPPGVGAGGVCVSARRL